MNSAESHLCLNTTTLLILKSPIILQIWTLIAILKKLSTQMCMHKNAIGVWIDNVGSLKEKKIHWNSSVQPELKIICSNLIWLHVQMIQTKTSIVCAWIMNVIAYYAFWVWSLMKSNVSKWSWSCFFLLDNEKKIHLIAMQLRFR